jgi:hypothetical protein
MNLYELKNLGKYALIEKRKNVLTHLINMIVNGVKGKAINNWKSINHQPDSKDCQYEYLIEDRIYDKLKKQYDFSYDEFIEEIIYELKNNHFGYGINIFFDKETKKIVIDWSEN